ncbi:hypothetical protein BDR06DRAFT_966786 [Suillus hirtellus]|nr:hypothetical protein BDR06DRAFT_966786 [Suillus hirtellus]
MPPKRTECKYYCSCIRKCGGVEKEVTRSAYRSHEKNCLEEAALSSTSTSSLAGTIRQVRIHHAQAQRESEHNVSHRSSSPSLVHELVHANKNMWYQVPEDFNLVDEIDHHDCFMQLQNILDHNSDEHTQMNDSKDHSIPDDKFHITEPLDTDKEVLQDDIYANIKRADLRASLAYILALQNASLDDPGTVLNPDAIKRLRNPLNYRSSIDDDPELRLTIHLYLALNNADDDYTKVVSPINKYNDAELPSHHQIKFILSQITGHLLITFWSVMNHITVKSNLLQWESKFPDASLPQYLSDSSFKLCIEVQREKWTCGSKESYNNFFDGSKYLEAVNEGKIKPEDHVPMFSTDGAQLFKNKQSDCWMSIWVVLDRSPKTHYKKKSPWLSHKNPPDFNIEGCDHPDVDVRNLGTCSPEVYWKDLVQCRLETGISKPSIFLGFPSDCIFGVPMCFGSVIIHLFLLNIPDLLIPLWHGISECDKVDDKSTWTWAVLNHITQTELCVAACLMIEFIEEFEDLYYKCHTMLLKCKWTMEHMIGNLIAEMRQLSKPYKNLSQHAQHNALMSIFPILDPDYNKPPFPKWSKDIGGGYALLKQQKCHRHSTSVAEGHVIQLYLQAYYLQSPEFGYFNDDGSFRITRWPRLWLPIGQTSQSLFATREQQHKGQTGLAVVKATYIQSVVAMVPHVLNDVHCFYLFEKPGLNVADLGGFLCTEDDGDGDDKNDK